MTIVGDGGYGAAPPAAHPQEVPPLTHEDLATIEEELSLHSLAIEDAVDRHERPKLDRYDSHLYLSAYSVTLDRETGGLATSEVGAFITKNALVTVGQDEGFDIDAAVARWDESAELAQHGVSFLLTTCCAPPNGQSRYVTSSRRSWRST